jgi:hypothetical protein
MHNSDYHETLKQTGGLPPEAFQRHPEQPMDPVPGLESSYQPPVQPAPPPCWDQQSVPEVVMTDTPHDLLNLDISFSTSQWAGHTGFNAHPGPVGPHIPNALSSISPFGYGQAVPELNIFEHNSQSPPMPLSGFRGSQVGPEHAQCRANFRDYDGSFSLPSQNFHNESSIQEQPKKSKKLMGKVMRSLTHRSSNHQSRPKSPEPLSRRTTAVFTPGTDGQARARLSNEAKKVLSEAFRLEHDPSQAELESIAARADLHLQTVKTWFNNRRSRAPLTGNHNPEIDQ